jgi:hypothetical protein
MRVVVECFLFSPKDWERLSEGREDVNVENRGKSFPAREIFHWRQEVTPSRSDAVWPLSC